MTNKQYFFMFSMGIYSDYSVGGLYVCDHEVSEEEWDAHYRVYQAEVEKRRKEYSDILYSSGVLTYPHPLHVTEAWNEYIDWREENNPETSFIKKHNMQPVEVSEFWRD